MYRTKGDNNRGEDKEKVSYSQIEGKYLFKINNFGNLIKVLQSKVTLAILILLVCLNTYFNYRLKYKRKVRREKRKKYEQNNI